MKNKDTKDLVMKEFEAYPDVAADLLNVFLYGGQYRVKENSLLAAPTETLYQGSDKLHSQIDYMGKSEMDSGRVKALYLFANQSKVDAKMLFRKAGYVGGAYREQYKSKKKAFFPVIELILYWGERRWNCRESLHELLHNKNAPDEVLRFTDDLRLHVFEMRNLPEETRRLFKSDMRIVVDYLAEGNSYRSDQKIVHKEALIKLLCVLSGDENVEDALSIMQDRGIEEEEEIKVCELFDQYERRGLEQGIKQMILDNLEENKSKEIIVGKLRRRFALSEEQAEAYFDKYSVVMV